MTSQFSVDASGLRALAVDLTAYPERVAARLPAVVERGALNVKKQQQHEAAGSPSFGRALVRAISYDVGISHGNRAVVEAEIGPSRGRFKGAPLGNVAYFGTSRGGGTLPDPQDAANAEAPRFEAAIASILDEEWRP